MDNIFSNNPKADLYYKTSDGSAFFSKNAARNHANTLTDKDVEKVTKNAVEKQESKAKKTEAGKASTDQVVTAELTVDKLLPSTDTLAADMAKTNPADAEKNVQEILQKGAEGVVVVTEQFLTDGLTKNAENASSQDVKLTPKQQVQADYQVKFGEVPAEEFTKNQLSEAIEKGEKLVVEPNKA
ncbi:hypothetical protein CLU96_1917 [Chryseobacterium sp. 52]|uniref:hypothetical protein n=1 Tax=Chryseobacterium sp. 52 TaxID=2035213 RepID=UPI000C189E55|nr:hypothetical protein [Chryseobacterium sp. 52]PIF44918.1 hypothetical protein CLU96_1917 [Chryseobacterium sp. 52]